MRKIETHPELLSPAGDWESLKAAVANGADAVYFGLSDFNARARATNFDPDELPTVMAYLHDRNVKGFVTLNTLIFSDELPKVVGFIAKCAEAGVDAFIVQDLGLVQLAQAMAPSLPIHASTQMTLTEPRGIAFAESLGVSRVVLARELSAAEVRKVATQTTIPVEVFIHGALCVAYSGQCLTSEALGGRSANRGQCAQACRLPYEMVVDGIKKELGDKAYLLSPQDLAAYEHVADLVDAGVVSFKIEGRLKGGPYVAATTQTYRKAIDAAVAKQAFQLPRQEELDLAQTFSRGLIPGFLAGVNHQKLVRGRVPKSRGVRLGRVVGVSREGVRVDLAEAVPNFIKPGDGVVFDMGTPEEKEPGGRVWDVIRTSPTSRVVELLFERETLDLQSIRIGLDIWKTDDPALRKRLEQSYSQDKPARRLVLNATLTGTVGGSLTLVFQAETGVSASATWAGPLELGRNRATTTEEIRAALTRLGDTPYELGELTSELPAGVMVPKSVLNDLRRQASAELVTARSHTLTHAVVKPNALQELKTAIPYVADIADVTPKLTVLVRRVDQLDAVLEWSKTHTDLAMVYGDFEDLRLGADAVVKARAAGVPFALAPLRVLKPGEEGFQAPIVRAKPDAVLVRNLGSIAFFRDALPQAKLIGDFSFNIANELTAHIMHKTGLERMVPSFDLNWDQFAALVQATPKGWWEPVVHQHMPMFHMEHCVFAAFLSTGKDHRDCGRPCDHHKVDLRDRVGASFPVLPDTGCRNTVFNSVPQSAAEYIGRMLEMGLRTFRIDLLRETPEQVGPLLNTYARLITGKDEGKETWKNLKVLNQLGVTRGTLQLV